METQTECMIDVVIEHICHYDALFNTTEKMFIFLDYKDYLLFRQEQYVIKGAYLLEPIQIMNTLVVYSEVKDCNKDIAWGSLNFKAATIPNRFICGYQCMSISSPLVMGVELDSENEVSYSRCLLDNYQGELNRE